MSSPASHITSVLKETRSFAPPAEFSKAKDEMFAVTDIPEAPWYTIESDDKRAARLNCISHLLEQIPYKDALPGPIDLPPRPKQGRYKRPPKDEHRVIEQDFWERFAA